MWNQGGRIRSVESWLWNHGCDTMAVESWLRNPDSGAIAVESWLWNPGCGIHHILISDHHVLISDHHIIISDHHILTSDHHVIILGCGILAVDSRSSLGSPGSSAGTLLEAEVRLEALWALELGGGQL